MRAAAGGPSRAGAFWAAVADDGHVVVRRAPVAWEDGTPEGALITEVRKLLDIHMEVFPSGGGGGGGG